ncbi:MAG: hypothetical protein CVT48_02435 [Thermoplasmata archaeon HGW-Thermoplasmata-1]|nr:MAG: hypothetical protein CVT48_02435 [Thermoplasmata archaeon HGW-Thermoplasmata-1]
MKTYLTVMFNSEGASPTDVKNQLMSLGFVAARGSYDFVYEWPEDTGVDNLVWFADKIHTALKGLGVMFTLETA